MVLERGETSKIPKATRVQDVLDPMPRMIFSGRLPRVLDRRPSIIRGALGSRVVSVPRRRRAALLLAAATGQGRT